MRRVAGPDTGLYRQQSRAERVVVRFQYTRFHIKVPQINMKLTSHIFPEILDAERPAKTQMSA
jgi:hypothetical protein